MLVVMENSPGGIFTLMEDDLLGRFGRAGDPEPLARDGALRMAGRRFDAVALCPLIMDFDDHGMSTADAYYHRPHTTSVDTQARDVLVGVRQYRRERPDGMLRIFPFLGVNPRNHTAESLSAFLERHLGRWTPGFERADAVFAAMDRYSSNDGRIAGGGGGECLFAGLKLYPPLGFDPWPDDEAEREKVEIVYGFCERRGIPIVTHCDDHGFRIVPMSDALAFSAPSRYRAALELFPRLKIDFAHFGRQYTARLGLGAATEWFDEVVDLIDEFPNVYADVSFNGVEPGYYERLAGALEMLPERTRDKVEARLLFGSDFVVNLMKIRCYADYYRIFDASPLEPWLRARMCSENPARFLFEGNPVTA
jgi:predicted TIM-barrel fold metal-dependent hydrolase